MKFRVILLIFSITLFTTSCDAASGGKFEVLTENMLPAIPVGSKVVIDSKAYTEGKITRGDIVVLSPSHNKSSFIITRIVGLPGETIEIKGESVFISGEELVENYAYYNNLRKAVVNDVMPTRIQPEMYYVMGDNRYNSFDSRRFGATSKADINGKVVKIEK